MGNFVETICFIKSGSRGTSGFPGTRLPGTYSIVVKAEAENPETASRELRIGMNENGEGGPNYD